MHGWRSRSEARTRGDGLSRFSATPVVNLRPSGSNIDIQVCYVTRASERFELRNRLYQHVVDLMQRQESPLPADKRNEVEMLEQPGCFDGNTLVDKGCTSDLCEVMRPFHLIRAVLQKSSKRPPSLLHRRAMIAFAPLRSSASPPA